MNLIIIDGENTYIYTEKITGKYSNLTSTEKILEDLGFNPKDCIYGWVDTDTMYIDGDITFLTEFID